jgi:hypothetical protein
MRLKLSQTGSQVQVWVTYRDSFSDRVSAIGALENDTVTWTGPQGCVARFRSPGYDYSNPGQYTVTLSLRHPADGAQPGPVLLYTQDTQWNAPCGGHPIGTERLQRVLTPK